MISFNNIISTLYSGHDIRSSVILNINTFFSDEIVRYVVLFISRDTCYQKSYDWRVEKTTITLKKTNLKKEKKRRKK